MLAGGVKVSSWTHLAMSELKTQVTLRTANSCLGRAGNKDVGASLPSPALRPTPYPLILNPLILKGVWRVSDVSPNRSFVNPLLSANPSSPCRAETDNFLQA
jgi:hypothetical protein